MPLSFCQTAREQLLFGFGCAHARTASIEPEHPDFVVYFCFQLPASVHLRFKIDQRRTQNVAVLDGTLSIFRPCKGGPECGAAATHNRTEEINSGPPVQRPCAEGGQPTGHT